MTPRDRADTAPRTKAGRDMLNGAWTLDNILAIEREAAAPDAPAPPHPHDEDCAGPFPHVGYCRRAAPDAPAPPALDVERARQAFGAHNAAHRGIDGLHPESCDEWIADMYARLSRLGADHD